MYGTLHYVYRTLHCVSLRIGPLPSELNAESRMREIVGRSRLVELAKAQAKEVGVLRKEVERLRMRTFPALVQLENI